MVMINDNALFVFLTPQEWKVWDLPDRARTRRLQLHSSQSYPESERPLLHWTLHTAHHLYIAQCAPTPTHCVNTTAAPNAAVYSSSCTAVRSKAFCTPVRISLAAPHNSATPSDHCSCSATFFVILQRIYFTTMCFYVSAFCDALELQGKHCTAPFGCNASWHWIHYKIAFTTSNNIFQRQTSKISFGGLIGGLDIVNIRHWI